MDSSLSSFVTKRFIAPLKKKLSWGCGTGDSSTSGTSTSGTSAVGLASNAVAVSSSTSCLPEIVPLFRDFGTIHSETLGAEEGILEVRKSAILFEQKKCSGMIPEISAWEIQYIKDYGYWGRDLSVHVRLPNEKGGYFSFNCSAAKDCYEAIKMAVTEFEECTWGVWQDTRYGNQGKDQPIYEYPPYFREEHAVNGSCGMNLTALIDPVGREDRARAACGRFDGEFAETRSMSHVEKPSRRNMEKEGSLACRPQHQWV